MKDWRIERAHDLWLEIRDGYGTENRLVADCVREQDAPLVVAALRLKQVLQQALDESGCDGDLCAHRWHEAAREILTQIKEAEVPDKIGS